METINNKPRIVIIESTDIRISDSLNKGMWPRDYATLAVLSQYMDIEYYTSDANNLQAHMPNSVRHKTCRHQTNIYGLRHLFYYIFLLFESTTWKKRGIMLLHVDGVNLPITPLIKLISRLPLVTRFHYNWAASSQQICSFILPKRMLSGIIQSFSLRASDEVICSTDYLRTVVETTGSMRSFHLVPNSVDSSLFTPSITKKKQIVFVGRLYWSKGADVLITAFKSCKERLAGYNLLIIGTGEELDHLRALASTDDRIHLCGMLGNRDVASVLGESEIFVLPSKTSEGHPIALCEAMMAGCTCIASDVKGSKEMMLDAGCADYLFKSNCYESLAERMVYAAMHPTHLQREHALKNYSADINLRAYATILCNATRPFESLRQDPLPWTTS
jgi:glycosyltransferase involved in cell wall biosynthesis